MARAVSKTAATKTAAAGTNYPVLTDRASVAAVKDYVAAKAEISRLEGEQEKRKAALVAAAAGAPVVHCGGHVLTFTDVPETPATPNTTITKQMVGQVIPGKRFRKGYVKLLVQ